MSEIKNAPGKEILKITGILGIIFTIIGLITIGTFKTTGIPASRDMTWSEIAKVGYQPTIVIPEWYFALMFIEACWSFFIYIMAILHCENLSKAPLLADLAGITIIVCIIDMQITSQWMEINAFMVLLSLVLPILFLVGAIQNKKALINKNK